MNCETGCQLFGTYRIAISIKDSAVLIHSTLGCNWGTLLFHTSSKLNDVRQSSTVIYEEEIINGGEKILTKSLEKTLNFYDAKVYFVITGCIPEIINDNAKSIVDKFNANRKKENIFLLSAPGFKGNQHIGVNKTAKILIDRMHKKVVKENSINLIGFFSDDYKIDADLENIKKSLSDIVSINAVFPYDYYENILEIPNGSLNVVLDGFEFIGEILKERFATEYVVIRYPYGISGTNELRNKILEALSLEVALNLDDAYKYINKIEPYISSFEEMPVAIVGDGARVYGLKGILENEMNMNVEVIVDTLKDSDVNNFKNKIDNSNVVMIFGTSFERDIAKKLDIPFLQFTYPVFDRVCLSSSGYAGYEGTLFLAEDIVNTIYSFKLK